MVGFQQAYGKNPGLSIAQVPESTRFFAGKGKIGIMERSESLAENMVISCGVLFLAAALIVSVLLIGAALFVALGG